MNANNGFDISDLREVLRRTIEALQDKDNPLEIERARAICDVSGKLIETAKVEVDYLRVTGATSGSGFIPSSTAPSRASIEPSMNGSKLTTQMGTCGSITQHRMR